MIANNSIVETCPWEPDLDHDTIAACAMGVRRGGRWILRPADFSFGSGVIGVAGPAGAGKSQLLATLATLRRPSTGSLRILGHDTSHSSGLRDIRTKLGYLPDTYEWANGVRVGDFVAYAAYFKRAPTHSLGPLLQRFDLADAAGITLRDLPRDLRLRAGLAATCVHEPELVMLDDPMAGLDHAERDELIPVMRSLAPTVVITAQESDGLLDWCDRVVTLTRGRLVDSPVRGLIPGQARRLVSAG